MGLQQKTVSGVQYRVKFNAYATDFDKDYLEFYFDKRFSSIYSWVFPKKDTLNVGLIGKFNQLNAFLGFLGLSGYTILKKEAGAIPVSGVPKKIVDGNMTLMGDAASMTNPLSCGGLTPIIHASSLLARNIDNLEKYQKKIKKHPMAHPIFLKAKNTLENAKDDGLSRMGGLFDKKIL